MEPREDRPPYEPPVVVQLGDLADLTQGGGDDMSDDGQGDTYNVKIQK